MIALAVHTNTQLYAHNYITLLHTIYAQTRPICTQLHNIIAHAVHRNTQLYAHNYITLLHTLYTQSHSYMQTIK